MAGDPPGPLPLYRLPEVLAARRVYVVEGEKAADRLRDLGVVATTSSHGAGSAAKADWSPLAGVEAVFLPDHDRPGEGYLASALGLLAAVDPPPRVKVVRLGALWSTDAAIPEGADAVDWLDDGVPEGWTDSECRAAPEAAADAAQVVALGTAVADHGAVLTCLADVEPEEIHWLWPGRLPSRSIVTLAGDPGLGKSFLTLDITARITRGHPWPDLPEASNPPGSVILLSAEDDLAATVATRLVAAGADRSRIYTMEVGRTQQRRRRRQARPAVHARRHPAPGARHPRPRGTSG